MEISATYGIVSYLLVDNWLRSARNAWFPRAMWNCVPCNGVFVIIFFETMYVKKNFRLGFCDICSNQGRGTCKCNRSLGNYVYYSLKMNTAPFLHWRIIWRKVHLLFKTAILCRVVHRIYRVFRISHCIYMYRYLECVFMVQCGESNMIWKRFYGATRSVWCDCF